MALSPEQTSLFCKDTPTWEESSLSLHDALPISALMISWTAAPSSKLPWFLSVSVVSSSRKSLIRFEKKRVCQLSRGRSEEHTSELQSRRDLVCRLLLEEKRRLQPEGHAGQRAAR